VVARLDGVTAVHAFVPDLDLALEADPIDAEVARTDDGYAVTVTARSFALDVTLLADRAAADARVDDALVTLPAGESRTFRVRTNVRNLEQVLDRQPVLRTANDLQHL
jgi:beta-mannosidase